MNNERRKKIKYATSLLNQARDIINDVMSDEDLAFNNLSEGLQCTLRDEQMENNVSEMEEAIDNIDEAMDNLNNLE